MDYYKKYLKYKAKYLELKRQLEGGYWGKCQYKSCNCQTFKSSKLIDIMPNPDSRCTNCNHPFRSHVK